MCQVSIKSIKQLKQLFQDFNGAGSLFVFEQNLAIDSTPHRLIFRFLGDPTAD